MALGECGHDYSESDSVLLCLTCDHEQKDTIRRLTNALESIAKDCSGCFFCAADLDAGRALGWLTADMEFTDKTPQWLKDKRAKRDAKYG